MNSVGPVMLQAQRFYHMKELSVSVLEPCKDISIAAISFVVASFVARWGYKRSMQLSLLVMTITCFAMPLIKTFFALELFFAVMGGCFGLMKVSVFGAIGLITRDRTDHIRLMNFTEGVFMTGILAGYFLFGAFIHDGLDATGDWLNVYFVLGLLTAGSLVYLSLSPLDERKLRVTLAESKAGLGSMGRLLILPVVTAFVLCAFFYVLVEQSIMSWLPSFNHTVLQLSSSESIRTAGILAAAMAAGRVAAGVAVKKVRWLTVLSVSLVGAAVLLFAAVWLSDQDETGAILWFGIPASALIFPLTGFFIAPIYPAINSIILSSLPASKHGTMAGLIVVVSAIGGSLGSVTTGFIFQRYDGGTAFYCSLIPIAVLFVLLFYFERISARTSGAGVLNGALKYREEIVIPG